MEAMGFGDVTLMAMIGAVIGWQGSILTFFLSPIAGLLIVMVVFVINRDPRTPYGPYLCVGTLLVVWFWDDVYNATFVRGTVEGARKVFAPFDKNVIDGGVMGLAHGVRALATRLRTVQTGAVQTYALAIVIGVVGVVALILFV